MEKTTKRDTKMDYFTYCLSYMFWEVEYKKRLVHTKFSEKGVSFPECVRTLCHPMEPLIEDDYASLRNVLCARFQQTLGITPATDTSQLSEEAQRACEILIKLAIEYGYYPWDLAELTDMTKIISQIYTDETVPLPPMPFVTPDNEASKWKAQLLLLKRGISYDPSQEVKELIQSPITSSIDSRISKEELSKEIHKIEVERNSRELMSHLILETPLEDKEETIQEFAKQFKQNHATSFSSGAMPSRAIGLYLYDRVVSTGKDINQILNNFLGIASSSEESELYKSIIELEGETNKEKSITDVDQSSIRRYYTRTINCIKNGEVKSLK